METVAELPDRYRLPARIRAKNAAPGDFSCRLALAERIAALPDIHTEESTGDTLPVRVDVFVQASHPSARRHPGQVLLFSIGHDGVALYGLHAWDKHQVLCAGWGSLNRDCVLLFLPRNEQELEVCWDIAQRAYRNVSTTLTQPALPHFAPARARPRFSRTTLQ
jgi:hypothetical protein